MTNENDYVCVEGNFVTQSYYSHNGRLTDGVLEVKEILYRKNISLVTRIEIILCVREAQNYIERGEAAESKF